MKLSDEQINAIMSKLNSISPNGITCPVCGNKQWAINNFVIESREFQHGGLIIGGNSVIVPYITITCRHCAHTLFFNAIQLGVVEPEQEKRKKDEGNGK